MSDANRVALIYAEETTYGTPPGGTYQALRITGETLAPTVTYTQSAELRADRQVADRIRTNIGGGGPINFEMSYGGLDTLLEATLQSIDWTATVTVTATDISAAASDNSFNSAGAGFTNLVENQWIKVSGFTGASTTANGLWKIVDKVSASKIIVAGKAALIDDAAGESVTILQGAYITNGTEQRSFTFEREYADLSNMFEQFPGSIPESMALTIQAGSLITGSITLLSKNGIPTSSTDAGAVTAAPTNDVMNAIDNVNVVFEGSIAAAGVQKLISIGINIANNLRARNAISVLGADSIGSGQFNLTGTMTADHQTATRMTKLTGNTPSQFAFVVNDAAGNTYVIDVPQMKFTQGQRPATAINTDVIEELSWEAYRDPVELVTMRIARFAA
jgi:hypothetical protein